MITSRTVIDNNGNPLHMGNPFYVTRSFNNSANSMSHSHHIRGSTSTNNATNSSQNALQRRSPQTFISSRTVVDNNGNLNSNNLENTVDMTGVNNTSVTSIPHSTRSRRIASANNATDRNLYRNAQQHRRMSEYWDCGDVAFRMARDRFSIASMQPVTLRLIGIRQRNARQYNLPTAFEVAALVPGDGNPTDSQDVIVEERGARKVEIL
ncbi:hypothetical protein Tco_1059014 [Tanacetum coccineum]